MDILCTLLQNILLLYTVQALNTLTIIRHNIKDQALKYLVSISFADQPDTTIIFKFIFKIGM